MPEYIIEKVSSEPPREWKSPQGNTIYYIKTKLQGVDKPVSIGKTKPDALKPGFKVNGSIEKTDLPEDKWHAEKLPFSGGGQQSFGGGSKPAYKDNSDGMRQGMCFNNAAAWVSLNSNGKNLPTEAEWADAVYRFASALYAKGDLKAAPVAEVKETTDEWGEMPPDAMPFEGGEINIADIPF